MKFEIILSDDGLAIIAHKIQGAFEEDENPVTLEQAAQAITRYFQEEVGEMERNPFEYFRTTWRRLEQWVKVVKSQDAEKWVKDNHATVAKCPPPAGWRDPWIEITTNEGNKFQGFSLLSAYETMIEAQNIIEALKN